MSKVPDVTTPDAETGTPRTLYGLGALAAIKSHVRMLEEPMPSGTAVTETTDTPASAEPERAEVEKTPAEDAVMFAEMRALLATPPTSDKPSPGRVNLPQAPEGVSRNIGELFGRNVQRGNRYWFYHTEGEKCGTATLKVVRSEGELAVKVVAVSGGIPGFIRELRMKDAVITLEVLVHPERLGDDEMSLKAEQLAEVLAGIRRRMTRSRSRNRHGKSEQKTQP